MEDSLAGQRPGLDRHPAAAADWQALTGTYRTAYGQSLRGRPVRPPAVAAHLMLRVVGQPQTIHQAIGIAS